MTGRLRLSLIEELDNRQNEVLDQLDELNQQVEDLLSQWVSVRTDEVIDPAQELAFDQPSVGQASA
ncbi:MAG: hypothetical protein NXI22_10740 [bacterium]|nr:hypothetical protein [bacterium]